MTVGPASVNRTAKLAGALHLLLVPFGIFSFAYMPVALIARGDAAATLANITASQTLYRGAIISHLASQIVVVFLMMALYRLFAPINRDRTRMFVTLALIGVPISFVAELNQFAILHLVSIDDVTPSQVVHFLEMHRAGVLLAQVFWGLWLLILSTLIFSSRCMPVWIGGAVLVGAAGYLFDSLSYFAGVEAATISQFTFAGELMLPLRLLAKGLTDHRRP